MDETTRDRTRINRTIYQLDLLHGRLSPQDFGRAMQQLLACAFEAAGFRVIENAVGVPDFTASRETANGVFQTFAFEVKTSDTARIVLTERDLDGIRIPGHTGVLAVLVFPARNPRWLLISEDALTARSWETRHLAQMQQVDVGFDLDEIFQRVIGSLDATLAPSGPPLKDWINSQRLAFHAINFRQVAT